MKFIKENWVTILILAACAVSYFFVDWSEISIFKFIGNSK